jgi:xylitol oxidase
LTNWAGNVRFGARSLPRPTSVAELQSIVAGSDRVRALGTGHSFNRIADTTGDLVSVADLPALMEIDTARRQVRVSAGTRYGELAVYLQAAGLALANLGSLPHISIAGACATGTHGSGDRNQVLAAAVSAIELVTATGELLELTRASDDFPGSVLALGALGVVSELTLDLVDTFNMQQFVYEQLELAAVIDNLNHVLSCDYSVSIFTDWQSDGRTLIWRKHRVDDDAPLVPAPNWLGGSLAVEQFHPLNGLSAASSTPQLGAVGSWNNRLPHFRLDVVPSSGDELQSEYFVSRHQASDAIRVVSRLRQQVQPLLQVTELRSIAADGLWLSPSYQRDTVAIHFTWIRDEAAVSTVLGDVERALAPFAAVPHWGKLSVAPPATVSAHYEHVEEFRSLANSLDPTGKFRNPMLDGYLQNL